MNARAGANRSTAPACVRCGLNSAALVHNASANGHVFTLPAGTPWSLPCAPCGAAHATPVDRERCAAAGSPWGTR